MINFELLFWVYVANSVLLIVHEIDSGYWQEWKLLNPKDEKGINWFLLLHFPMVFGVLYGQYALQNRTMTGLIISAFVAAAGIFAFVFHSYHLKKGRPEFNTPISKAIIIMTFIVSVVQAVVSIGLMLKK